MKKAILSICAVVIMILSCLAVVSPVSELQADGSSSDDTTRWGLEESIDGIDEIIASLWYAIPGFKMTSLEDVVVALKSAASASGLDPEDILLEATCEGRNTVIGEEIKTSRIITDSSMSVFLDIYLSMPMALLSSYGGVTSIGSDELLVLDLEIEVSRISECHMYFNELGNMMDEDYYSETFIHIKGLTNISIVDDVPVIADSVESPLDFFFISVTDSSISYVGDGFKMFPQGDEETWDVEVFSIQDTEYSIHFECNEFTQELLNYISTTFALDQILDYPFNPDSMSGFIFDGRKTGISQYTAQVYREDGEIKHIFFNDVNHREGVTPFYDPFSWITVPAKPLMYDMTYIQNAVHPLDKDEYQSYLEKMDANKGELDRHTKDLSFDIHFLPEDADSFDEPPLHTITVSYDDPIDLSYEYDAGNGKKTVYWRIAGTDQYASPSDRVHCDLYLVAVLADVVDSCPVSSDFKESSESIIYWTHDVGAVDAGISWEDLGDNPDMAVVIDVTSGGKPLYRWYLQYDGKSYLSGMFDTGISFTEPPNHVKWALDGDNIMYLDLNYQGQIPEGVKLRLYLDGISDGENVLLYTDDGREAEFRELLKVNNGVAEFYTEDSDNFALLLPDVPVNEEPQPPSMGIIVIGIVCILIFAVIVYLFLRRTPS